MDKIRECYTGIYIQINDFLDNKTSTYNNKIQRQFDTKNKTLLQNFRKPQKDANDAFPYVEFFSERGPLE